MIANEKEALREMVQNGAYRLLKVLADEIYSDMEEVKFSDKSTKMAYEMGKRDGSKEFVSEFFNRLEGIANE